MRTRFGACLVSFCAAVAATGASAQSPEIAQYPDKPVRIVVTAPPGGPTDVVARTFAESLSKTLGPLVIDNRAGASGMIAIGGVARAAPDGYTLIVNHGGAFVAPLLMAAPPVDPVADLTPISLLATMPMLLLVNSSVPAKSVQDLVALAKAQPGKLNYGSGGLGDGFHLAGELLRMVTGMNIVHVPYKGGAPAMTGLLAGEVQVMFNGLPNSLSALSAGQVRALASGGTERTAMLPELPTITESGYPFDYSGWYGLHGPAGMPKPLVDKIHSSVIQALAMQTLKDRLKGLGIDGIGSTPERLKTHVLAEKAKWTRVTEAAGIRGKQ